MTEKERLAQYVASIQAAGHVLRMTEDGAVDIDAWNEDNHQGPLCERCCGAWCIYCETTVEPCRPFKLGILASAFDPFPHPGHLWTIQQALAADACDAILAALQEDPTLERPQKRKPALSVEERTQLLLACRYVHAVVPYRTEADLLEILRDRRPAVRIIGEDHRHDRNTGDDLEPPIPVFWAKRKPAWSGTEMARRIYDTYADQRDREIAREATAALQQAVQSWVEARCPCPFPAWDGSQTGGSEATMQEFGSSQGGAAMIAKFGAGGYRCS